MTDAAPALDRAALLASLGRNEVSFVLVGDLAAHAHGAVRATKDADICPEWSKENIAHPAASLTELKARLKIGEGSVETLEVEMVRLRVAVLGSLVRCQRPSPCAGWCHHHLVRHQGPAMPEVNVPDADRGPMGEFHVQFDEPQRDSDGLGPYNAAVIWEKYPRRID